MNFQSTGLRRLRFSEKLFTAGLSTPSSRFTAALRSNLSWTLPENNLFNCKYTDYGLINNNVEQKTKIMAKTAGGVRIGTNDGS